MEIFSPLLAFNVWNLSVTGEFTTQRPATRCFDVFFDLRLNLQVRKQWRSRWFETPSRSLWRHCNVFLGLWTGARHNYWTENTNHFTYLVMTMEYISLALMLECHLFRFYCVFILVCCDIFDHVVKSGTGNNVWLPKCMVTLLALVFCWPALSPRPVPSITPKCDREWQCLFWTITVIYGTEVNYVGPTAGIVDHHLRI